MQLPVSRYNLYINQCFNICHLTLGTGDFKLMTEQQEKELLRLEYETMKEQGFIK